VRIAQASTTGLVFVNTDNEVLGTIYYLGDSPGAIVIDPIVHEDALGTEKVIVDSDFTVWGKAIATRFSTDSLTLYRRDNDTNTELTVYYTTMANGLRMFVQNSGATPDCYSSTEDGARGVWGAVGDICILQSGTGTMWMRTTSSGDYYWMQVTVS
jgi:hypothetical protein